MPRKTADADPKLDMSPLDYGCCIVEASVDLGRARVELADDLNWLCFPQSETHRQGDDERLVIRRAKKALKDLDELKECIEQLAVLLVGFIRDDECTISREALRDA